MAAPTRFIALFGPRDCGKTVYLAALYGSSANGPEVGEEYHVASNDDPADPTHIYLARAYRDLASGSWPPGTAFDELKRMLLTFTTGGAAYRLVLPDVGGELTTRVRESRDYDLDTRALKERILHEYQDYHGFIVFAPVGPVPWGDSIEYKWEVDALIQALKERTPDGALISRPVAVVMSKWDLLGPISPGDADTAAAEYFSKAYPELSAGLAATCKNLRFFPISSTGRLVGGKPPVPLAPFNLGAPLSWLLWTSDEVMVNSLEAYVRSSADKLFRRSDSRPERPTFFSLAMARVDQFLKDVPHGPLAERALQHRQTLLKRRRGRRIRMAGACLATLAGVLALAGAIRDHGTYRATSRLVEAKGTPGDPGEVLHAVDSVLAERSRVMGRLMGWWRDLASTRDRFYQAHEAAMYAELERLCPPGGTASAKRVVELAGLFKRTFPTSSRQGDVSACREAALSYMNSAADRQDYAGIKEVYETFDKDRANAEIAESLLGECTHYLESHQGGMHTDEVQKIKADVEVERIKQLQALDFAQLELELAKASENPFKCYQLCAAFFVKWPQHAQAVRVRSQQEEFLKKADEQEWKSVLAFAAKYPTSYAEQLSQCLTYTSNVLYKAHRDDASKFQAAALRGLDRTVYEEIRHRAKAGNEPEVLDGVQKLCRAYLDNTSIPNKAMADEVEAWLRWFDSWVQGRDFYVEVESVRVNRHSQWHYTLYWPTVWAEVRVNGTNHGTGSKCIDLDRDERGLPNSRLGPFHWKWNDPNVVVALSWANASPPSFVSELENDPYRVRHLNGQVDFDGGKISVRLRCPDVLPPALRPYTE